VSFTVRWTAEGGVTHLDYPDQRYRGDMRVATAQMDRPPRSGIYDHASAPLATSAHGYAQIGQEGSGSFF